MCTRQPKKLAVYDRESVWCCFRPAGILQAAGSRKKDSVRCRKVTVVDLKVRGEVSGRPGFIPRRAAKMCVAQSKKSRRTTDTIQPHAPAFTRVAQPKQFTVTCAGFHPRCTIGKCAAAGKKFVHSRKSRGAKRMFFIPRRPTKKGVRCADGKRMRCTTEKVCCARPVSGNLKHPVAAVIIDAKHHPDAEIQADKRGAAGREKGQRYAYNR